MHSTRKRKELIQYLEPELAKALINEEAEQKAEEELVLPNILVRFDELRSLACVYKQSYTFKSSLPPAYFKLMYYLDTHKNLQLAPSSLLSIKQLFDVAILLYDLELYEELKQHTQSTHIIKEFIELKLGVEPAEAFRCLYGNEFRDNYQDYKTLTSYRILHNSYFYRKRFGDLTFLFFNKILSQPEIALSLAQLKLNLKNDIPEETLLKLIPKKIEKPFFVYLENWLIKICKKYSTAQIGFLEVDNRINAILQKPQFITQIILAFYYLNKVALDTQEHKQNIIKYIDKLPNIDFLLRQYERKNGYVEAYYTNAKALIMSHSKKNNSLYLVTIYQVQDFIKQYQKEKSIFSHPKALRRLEDYLEVIRSNAPNCQAVVNQEQLFALTIFIYDLKLYDETYNNKKLINLIDCFGDRIFGKEKSSAFYLLYSRLFYEKYGKKHAFQHHEKFYTADKPTANYTLEAFQTIGRVPDSCVQRLAWLLTQKPELSDTILLLIPKGIDNEFLVYLRRLIDRFSSKNSPAQAVHSNLLHYLRTTEYAANIVYAGYWLHKHGIENSQNFQKAVYYAEDLHHIFELGFRKRNPLQISKQNKNVNQLIYDGFLQQLYDRKKISFLSLCLEKNKNNNIVWNFFGKNRLGQNNNSIGDVNVVNEVFAYLKF